MIRIVHSALHLGQLQDSSQHLRQVGHSFVEVPWWGNPKMGYRILFDLVLYEEPPQRKKERHKTGQDSRMTTSVSQPSVSGPSPQHQISVEYSENAMAVKEVSQASSRSAP
jgi:hypothetical protein